MMLLSDVCLSVAYIKPKSRTERPGKTKIGTEVAKITCDSDTTFKVKGQLVADILNSQHARTGATWRINTKILSTCRGRGLSWRLPAYSLFDCNLTFQFYGSIAIQRQLAFMLLCLELSRQLVLK